MAVEKKRWISFNLRRNNFLWTLCVFYLLFPFQSNFGKERNGIGFVESYLFNETVTLIEESGRKGLEGRDLYLEHHYLLFHFGFEEGGSIQSFNINPLPSTLSNNSTQRKEISFLSICNKDEYFNVFQRLYNRIDYCSVNSTISTGEGEEGEPMEWKQDMKYPICWKILSFNSNGLTVKDLMIPSRSSYFFVLSNCATHSKSYAVEAELRNRNGEQLSTQYIPLPTFYFSLLPVWIIVVLAFTFNGFQHRKQSVPLHKLIWSIPILKALHCGFNTWYWNYQSRWGSISPWASFLYYFFFLASEILIYSTIFLISKGWGLTRSSLSVSELKSLCVVVGSLSLASLLYQRNGSYFLFALVIMYVISMKYVFAGLEHNLRSLFNQEQFLIQRANFHQNLE